jgi:hypothetical protein
MTRKTTLSIVFMSVTGVAVGWELVAVVNTRDDIEPWTSLIADHVPPAITAAAILLLVSWLPGHFIEAYAQRGKTMTDVEVPTTPPPGSPKQPLLKDGSIATVVAAAITIAAAFGFNLSEDLTTAILVIVATLTPVVLTLVARMHVFAPATVRAMVVTAANTGETNTTVK